MTQLKAFIIPVTPFQQNCSLVYDDERKVGAIVDPGGDVPVILDAIKQSGITIEKILLTHGHIDHAGGAAELKEKLGGVPIEGPHEEDTFLLDDLAATGAKYGYEARPVTPDRWLKEGDTVTVGGLAFKIRTQPQTEFLYPLGDDVVCLPGHGQPCQIGQERETNPFLNEQA